MYDDESDGREDIQNDQNSYELEDDVHQRLDQRNDTHDDIRDDYQYGDDTSAGKFKSNSNSENEAINMIKSFVADFEGDDETRRWSETYPMQNGKVVVVDNYADSPFEKSVDEENEEGKVDEDNNHLIIQNNQSIPEDGGMAQNRSQVGNLSETGGGTNVVQNSEGLTRRHDVGDEAVDDDNEGDDEGSNYEQGDGDRESTNVVHKAKNTNVSDLALPDQEQSGQDNVDIGKDREQVETQGGVKVPEKLEENLTQVNVEIQRQSEALNTASDLNGHPRPLDEERRNAAPQMNEEVQQTQDGSPPPSEPPQNNPQPLEPHQGTHPQTSRDESQKPIVPSNEELKAPVQDTQEQSPSQNSAQQLKSQLQPRLPESRNDNANVVIIKNPEIRPVSDNQNGNQGVQLNTIKQDNQPEQQTEVHA